MKRVLVANRGEIAIRIAKAAAGLGMESVGVYAPVDALALHTRCTTQARELANGRGPVQAYLDAKALVRTALDTGCDCVHPGYGFLAENALFATLCADKGLTFVGPQPEALALFGDKMRARQLAHSLGIPVVPGSEEPVTSAQAAVEAAEAIGYPVMLKASAGGGGRGMRTVDCADDMAAAFDRCLGEAEAAFGDIFSLDRGAGLSHEPPSAPGDRPSVGPTHRHVSLFVEKLVRRPKHIEVQILADAQGQVVHLHERDCSVQVRHQKLIEMAPAPGLDEALRQRLLDDAIKLAEGASYLNAGTVEFLVSPEAGLHYFIECNPRIQVEHTVTEQVTGVDLVEAQFRIAAGASLADLGLADQATVGAPRGFAVQARVTVEGAGTISAYKEPSGPGVRVDAAGYLGYAPPPEFDPLLAKVIGTAGFGASFGVAADRTRRALAEFHVTGLPTNLAALQAILAHPALLGGDARTTLLTEEPGLLSPPSVAVHRNSALALLEQAQLGLRTDSLNPASVSAAQQPPQGPSLAIEEGQVAVECPMTGTVVETHADAGATVAAGETLLVITAMKMESEVQAPCPGVLTKALALQPGDGVHAGQVLAAITPAAGAEPSGGQRQEGETWAPLLAEAAAIQRLAHERLQHGSEDPGVIRQRSRGKLTCRERIDLLLDDGSFQEVGSLAGFPSYDGDGNISAFTPANHVGGWGRIDGRPAVACADDFTSRGGHADGAIGAKSIYLDRLSLEMRTPAVRLLDGSSGGGSVAAMVPQQRRAGESAAKESAGAIKAGRPRVAGGGGSFLPPHLGSSMYAEQLATVPVVNVLLGSVVGIGAAKAVLGHFSVMVRDIAQLFVAGPPVVSHAMGYDIDKEALGGWHIHCRNGSVDNLAETEAEAATLTKRFLSYLPSSVYEPPPVQPPDPNDPPDRQDEALFTLIPRKRTAAFDMRRAIRLMADRDSFLEIGPLWGTDQITGLARMNGHPIGVLASDSRHVNGGALTADGCRKLTRHQDLCDLFHLPILNLVDNPGFAVGLEHETAGTIRRGGEWMIASAQATVPIFTVLMRRSFGVAGNNFASPRSRPSMRVAWPAADVGGIPPEGGIEAAYKRQLAEAEDPKALRDELMARIESARGPIGPLSKFQIEELIDPRDTRRMICEWVRNAYRIVAQPARLKPRVLQFRP